jgi:hypothetical protein
LLGNTIGRRSLSKAQLIAADCMCDQSIMASECLLND